MVPKWRLLHLLGLKQPLEPPSDKGTFVPLTLCKALVAPICLLESGFAGEWYRTEDARTGLHGLGMGLGFGDRLCHHSCPPAEPNPPSGCSPATQLHSLPLPPLKGLATD